MMDFLIPVTVNVLPSIDTLQGRQGMFILPDGSININTKSGTWFTINKRSDHRGVIKTDTVITPVQGEGIWFWASEGVYPNAGNVSIAKYGIVSFNGNTWASMEVELPETKTDKYDVVKSTASAYDNLIDFANLIPDTYVRQDNGTKQIAAGYSTTGFIKVLPQKRYLIPGLYKQFAFYDEIFQFIPDNQSATAQDFDGTISIVTPVNAMYIDLTLLEEKISEYYLKLNQSLAPLRAKKTLYVSSEGGDFRRITDALKYADSTGERHTLMLDGEVYAEKLELISPVISHAIIGLSKVSTIITNSPDPLNSYEPLKVSGGWHFENISIISQVPGYAVHSDYPGEGLTEFFNCKIENISGSIIGAGSHKNQTLRLKNVELINTGAQIGTGALYWHNNVKDGITGQRLEVINCDVRSNLDQALRLDDANLAANGSGNEATVMFVGNTFYSGGWGVGDNVCDFRPFDQEAPGMLVGNSIKLDARSFGNNIPRINY